MYRVVVETGADFSANVGDEAYFAAMVDLFRSRFGAAIEIVKFANEPEKIAERYGIRSLYSGWNFRRRLAALWPTLKAIATADLYVWGGGQMPLDSHGVLSVLYRFHRPLLARLLGTPVMSYAVGAGPLDLPHSRVIVRHAMNAFDLITVRDRYSVSLLKAVGVRKPVHETVDSAVVLEPAARERVEAILRAEGVPLDRPLVGVVPWGPAFRRLKSVVPVIFRRRHFTPENLRHLDAHCAILAGALDAFLERHDAFAVFVAMDCSKGHGFDDEVARRAIAAMKRPDRARLLQGVYHPKEVKGILGRCDIVAGSRMHGLILATGERVPTVGICFTEKIRDFGRLTGQIHSYVNAGDLRGPQDLVPFLERCWDRREASRRAIDGVLREFRARVRQNVGRLARLVTTGPRARRRPEGRVRNINTVRRKTLCHFCGTCYGICPSENIRIGREWNDQPRFAAVDPARCVDCGLCWRVCPGREVDFEGLRRSVFGGRPADPRIGCAERLLLTQSTRPAVRERATSGGTVGEVLRYALEAGLVDGAAVTRMDFTGDRPRPHTWIARQVAELDQLRGSLYMTAPVGTVLRSMRREPMTTSGGSPGGARRFALVGLGCHVEGLRAAQRELLWARERVPLVIGLFCGHGVSPSGTWHLLRRLGFSAGEITELTYREGPMPGRFRAASRPMTPFGGSAAAGRRSQDGRVREMPMREYGYALTAYGNWRCATCVDPLCELADVSVGDAWLPEVRGRGDWNLTVVRTPAGARVIDALVAAGRLRAEETTADRVSQAQRLQLYQRERGAWARMHLLRGLGRAAPRYGGVARPGEGEGEGMESPTYADGQRFDARRRASGLLVSSPPAAVAESQISDFKWGGVPRLQNGDFLRAMAVGLVQLAAQARWMQGWMVPVAGLARQFLSRCSARKDALVGRDHEYRRAFFGGGDYAF